jgi:hypothetical protein
MASGSLARIEEPRRARAPGDERIGGCLGLVVMATR